MNLLTIPGDLASDGKFILMIDPNDDGKSTAIRIGNYAGSILLSLPNQSDRALLNIWLSKTRLVSGSFDSWRILEGTTLSQSRNLLKLHPISLAFVGTKFLKKNIEDVIQEWKLLNPNTIFILTGRSFQGRLATICRGDLQLYYLVLKNTKLEDFQSFLSEIVCGHQESLEDLMPISQLASERYKVVINQRNQMRELMQKVEEENRRKTRELEEARAMQVAMLPKGKPAHSRMNMEAYMHTATEVGGDYYDFVQIEEDHFLAVIGDVTGHGFKSGVVVATVKSYFQAFGATMHPSNLLSHISQGIKSLGLRNIYMGLCLIEVKGSQLHIWSSGMPALYHYSSTSAKLNEIRMPGMFLGSSIAPNLQSFSCHLKAGDLLIAMTDGMSEGIQRHLNLTVHTAIANQLKSQDHLTAKKVLYSLIKLCYKWRDEKSYEDDISFLVFNCNGSD